MAQAKTGPGASRHYIVPRLTASVLETNKARHAGRRGPDEKVCSGERWSLSRQGGDWAFCVPPYEPAFGFAARLVTKKEDPIPLMMHIAGNHIFRPHFDA
jgi:hypothetical protein